MAQVQAALDTIIQWSHTWGLKLSAQKTKAMICTRQRKQPPYPLKIENLPVEYVSNFSFLGIVLDRKLNWGPHIARLKETSQKDLRLLSLLAHNKWSADYVSLRRIYTAVLLRKIEYGGFLFATAAPTHLLTQTRIQYAAASLILGALCCIRVDALEAEADLLPLSLRFNIQLAKYAAKILSIPDHPLGSLVHDYYHYQLYK